MFAGHLPTHRFTLAEWSAMQEFAGGGGLMAPDGWSRQRTANGKPVCVFVPPLPESLNMAFAVRPIVRVKMGRRIVTDDEQAEYEFLAGSQWTKEQAARMVVR